MLNTEIHGDKPLIFKAPCISVLSLCGSVSKTGAFRSALTTQSISL